MSSIEQKRTKIELPVEKAVNSKQKLIFNAISCPGLGVSHHARTNTNQSSSDEMKQEIQLKF